MQTSFKSFLCAVLRLFPLDPVASMRDTITQSASYEKERAIVNDWETRGQLEVILEFIVSRLLTFVFLSDSVT